MNQSSNYNGAKVLITGGLGLIGSTTAINLVEQGANVTITDSLLPLYGGNLFNIDQIKDKVTLFKKDIRDQKAVNELVKGKDYIFNYAAQVSYSDSQRDPYLDLDINLIGHLNILTACVSYNPTAKIVFSGSRMQYGRITSNPVDEDHPTKPLSVYGTHKNTAEQYYQIYGINYGIRSTCFRITNPYGPRGQMKHNKYSIVNWFVRQAMEGNTIKIFGDGSQKRDYIFVDDIVQGILQAAVQPSSDGQVYNIGSGTVSAFKEMVTMILDTVGKGKIEHVPWPTDYWNVETGDFVVDTTKLTTLTKWRPITTLQQGIEATVKYYQQYSQHYWQ